MKSLKDDLILSQRQALESFYKDFILGSKTNIWESLFLSKDSPT